MNHLKIKNVIISSCLILIFLTLGFVGVLTFEGLIDSGSVSASPIIVAKSGGDYNTIQLAIDNAKSGDTIYVWSGTYFENVEVSKSINLIGNGSSNTTIDAGGKKNVIKITANNVKVSGFKTINSGSGGQFIWDSGIKLWNVQNNVITNNNCSNNTYGIFIKQAESNRIENNTCVSNNQTGIFLDDYSKFNNVKNNTCTFSKTYTGIRLEKSHENIIENNNCYKNNKCGINILWSDLNEVRNNTVNSNYAVGIHLGEANSNIIKNNICNFNSESGIFTYDSDSNIIKHNTCNSNNDCGIFIYINSDSNIIENNFCNFSKEKDGIVSLRSKFNIVKNNSMYSCSMGVDGSKLQHWNTHTIDKSNTVNDKPVYYWKNRTSGIVPTNIAQIILANCSNITIENLKKSNIKIPIWVGFSSNIKIINNNLSQNAAGCYIQSSNNSEIKNNICESNERCGIFLSRSKENIILNNSISKTSEDGDGIYLAWSDRNFISNNSCTLQLHGIHVELSKFNTLCNNNVSFNTEYGIFINYSSDGNIIENNYISKNNEIGIFINNSNSTEIYHNHFIDNIVQAKELGISYNNHWDNGKGEGNYWSDYIGLDNGANKRIKGDGVGDTEIPHLGLDNYPLVNKSGWLFPGIPILFDIEHDSYGFDSNGKYNVTWFHNRDVTGFILERDSSDQFLSPMVIYNGSDQYYLVDQKINNTYYYRVKAYKNEHESPWSNVVYAIVDHPPEMPVNLTVSVYPEGNTLNISWKPNQVDTSKYDLFYKKKSETIWVRAAEIYHPKHSFNHTKLEDNQEYEYKLLARDGRNQVSSFSEIVNGIPQDSVAPGPPEGFRVVSTTYNSIELTWEPNSEDDSEGYRIYKSIIPNPSSWGEPIVNFTEEDNEFTDTNVDEATTYYYVITAFDEVPNESNQSIVISGSTKLGPHEPEINNFLQDFTIMEDTIDNTSINLQDWFRDKNADKLTYKCSGNVYIEVIINEENGSVTLIPESDWSGAETIIFCCSDDLFEIRDNVTITVVPVNDPPETPEIISPKDGLNIKEGEKLTLEGQCIDADLPYGDELTFHWSSNIRGELGTGDKLSSIKLPAGKHTITLNVMDSTGNTSQKSIDVTVLRAESGTPIALLTNVNFIVLLLVIIFIIIAFVFLKKKRTSEAKEEKIPKSVPIDISPSLKKFGFTPSSDSKGGVLESGKIATTAATATISKPVLIQPTIFSSVTGEKLAEQSLTAPSKQPTLSYQTKLIGRDSEMNELQGYLKETLDGQSNTIFVSGEAGIGKTRLVNELMQVAQTQGFQTLSSYCFYESLTPFMPIRDALKAGGLDYLFTEEMPRVEAVYLISHSGILIKEIIRKETKLNPSIFASMLTTVSNFVMDSISILSGDETEGTLNTLGFENYRILIETRGDINLVVILTGKENEFLISNLKEILSEVVVQYSSVLKDWDGVVDKVGGIETLLQPLITSGKYDGIYVGEEDPKTMRNLLFDNVTMGLSRESQIRPVLLCIEDLQWSDPSSLALMHHIQRNSSDCKLLILGTYRSEEVSMKKATGVPLLEIIQLMDREEMLTKMELERLPKESIGEIILSMYGGKSVNEDVKTIIYRETEGNPLFIIELAKYLVEEKIIVYYEGTWELAKKIDEQYVPPKIYHVIVRRLQRLERKYRELLDYAAVIGENFSSDILGETLKLKRLELLEMLRDLELTHRLIYSDNGNYKFTHAKLKEVIYEELPPELRMEYHSVIAKTIERLNKNNLHEVLESLAFHYLHCGNKTKAPSYLMLAAQKAQRNYSNSEAIRFYTEALTMVEEPLKKRNIFDSLGEIYDLLGDYDKSQEAYINALELTSELEKTADIKAKLGILHLKKGDYDKAIQQSSEALKLVKNKKSKESALAYETTGYTYHRKGDYNKAFKYHKKSLDIREKLNETKGIANSYKNLGMVQVDRGEFENALKYFNKSLAIFDDLNDNQGVQLCFSNIGALYFNKGEYEKAFEYYEKSFEIVEKTGDQGNIAILLLNIGQSLLLTGEVDKALENLEKSLIISKTNSLQMVAACDYWVIAEAYIEKSDLDKALEYSNQAFSIAKELGAKEIIAALRRVFGIIHGKQGRWEISIHNFKESIKILQEIGNNKELGDTYFEFGKMWQSKGDFSKSRETLKEAINIFKKLKLERKRSKVLAMLEGMETKRS